MIEGGSEVIFCLLHGKFAPAILGYTNIIKLKVYVVGPWTTLTFNPSIKQNDPSKKLALIELIWYVTDVEVNLQAKNVGNAFSPAE